MYIVNDNSSPPHFIEAGIFEGYICSYSSGNFQTCYVPYSHITSPTLFWGDDRDGCGCYYAHFGGAASLFTDYSDMISQQDSTDWGVQVGSLSGTSTNNPLAANLIRAGTEESSQTAGIIACNAQKDLEFENANGVWSTSGWSDNQGAAYTEGDNPPHRMWLTPDSWIRDWDYNGEPSDQAYSDCWPSGATTASSPTSSTATAPASSPASSPATGPKLTEGQVRQIAQQFSAAMGDANPISIEHAESTREQAVSALSGDDVPSTQDVYAIVIRGQFVASNAPRPSDAPAPTGSVLTMAIDATTGALTDFGVQSQTPDLASLGPVTLDQ